MCTIANVQLIFIYKNKSFQISWARSRAFNDFLFAPRGEKPIIPCAKIKKTNKHEHKRKSCDMCTKRVFSSPWHFKQKVFLNARIFLFSQREDFAVFLAEEKLSISAFIYLTLVGRRIYTSEMHTQMTRVEMGYEGEWGLDTLRMNVWSFDLLNELL